MVNVWAFVNDDVIFVLNDLVAILADWDVADAFYFVLNVNGLELAGLVWYYHFVWSLINENCLRIGVHCGF